MGGPSSDPIRCAKKNMKEKTQVEKPRYGPDIIDPQDLLPCSREHNRLQESFRK
jgi:hypothetical protein